MEIRAEREAACLALPSRAWSAHAGSSTFARFTIGMCFHSEPNANPVVVPGG